MDVSKIREGLTDQHLYLPAMPLLILGLLRKLPKLYCRIWSTYWTNKLGQISNSQTFYCNKTRLGPNTVG